MPLLRLQVKSKGFIYLETNPHVMKYHTKRNPMEEWSWKKNILLWLDNWAFQTSLLPMLNIQMEQIDPDLKVVRKDKKGSIPQRD